MSVIKSTSRVLCLLSLALCITSSRATVLRRVEPMQNATTFNSTLSWGPCTDYAAPYQCATFRVPLDYACPEVGSTTLAMVRLPASTSPREGYMFYNPGGPGASGVELVGLNGAKLQAQLGAGWDILGWDPRGVGKSGPDLTLFDTSQEYDAFWNQLQGVGKFEAHGNLTQSSDAAFFRSQAPAFDEFLQQFDSKYRAKSGDSLKYVGTCAVVRDLVGMVDAIYGPTADVNFYGYSYGTLIAAYLTQMFPHRVGKVIADGVLDAYTWYNTSTMVGLSIDVEDAEAALLGWSTACASSRNCTLASIGNGTAEGVKGIIDSVLNTAYKTYDGTVWSQTALVTNGTLPSDIHAWPYDVIASLMYELLSTSSTWPILDQFITGLYAMQNNITSPSLAARSKEDSFLPFPRAIAPHWSVPIRWSDANSVWSQAQYPIGCGDSQRTPSNYTTATLFEQIIRASQDISPHYGSVLSPRWFCHRWTTRAVERLSAPFSVKPKNVVLVIGNTADPVTPYSSAKALASKERLGDKARLVKFNAVGHVSGSNNSTCINNIIRSYVQGGVIEDKGDDDPDVVCEVDSASFSK